VSVLYITEDHAYITKSGATLYARLPDGQRRALPLEQITDVVCYGDVSWSGAALRELAAGKVGIAFLDGLGRWLGRLEPPESKAVFLRRAQFRASDDPVRSTTIARVIVQGKVRNCRSLLQRAQRDGMVEAAAEILELGDVLQRLISAQGVDRVRGLEGDAARCYFGAYGRLVSGHGFVFAGRQRRPPPDPVNAMLSFGYALLERTAAAAVRIVGFDAHVGFLHADRYGRESLALDSLVAALVHRRVVGVGDFVWNPTECRLSDAARRTFIQQLERKLVSEVHHPVLKQRVTHRRAMELQARILAKHLTGEIETYVSFSKR